MKNHRKDYKLPYFVLCFEIRTSTNSAVLKTLIVKQANHLDILLRGMALNNLYRNTYQEFEREFNHNPVMCPVLMLTIQSSMHIQ